MSRNPKSDNVPAVSLGGRGSLLDPAQIPALYRDVLPPSVRGHLESVHLDLLRSCAGARLVDALRVLGELGKACTRAYTRTGGGG